MKRKSIFILPGFILIGFFIWWFWYRITEPPIKPSPVLGEVEASTNLTPQSQLPIRSAVTSSTQGMATNRERIAVRQTKAKQEREQRLDAALNDWRTPIEFYGRIVDESNSPVSGVQINFSCNDLSQNGTSHYDSQSDANGFFSLRGVTGKLLVVRISKAGYYISKQDNNSFEYGEKYSHFIPDAGNPITFHLRKKNVGETLVHFHKSFRVPKDGTPIQIDLATGDQASSSQNALKVECWTHDAEKKPRGEYDWKCQISVVGGGLQIYDDEFPFLAPPENYVPSDEIDMTVKPDVRWQSDVERRYFIQTPDGKFGRIVFGMVAGGDHFCVIDSFFNLSGSRNLEPTTP